MRLRIPFPQTIQYFGTVPTGSCGRPAIRFAQNKKARAMRGPSGDSKLTDGAQNDATIEPLNCFAMNSFTSGDWYAFTSFFTHG
ncbi:Uncharacterised protein [Burkholderia oklahomensis]|nr:hypothetical protein BG90_1121 [Burkholderia oklahomensis C6786]SUW59461.1 Uncharacterised protein [Burkholderia oklahomensis]